MPDLYVILAVVIFLGGLAYAILSGDTSSKTKQEL